jgi:hypothetical protein
MRSRHNTTPSGYQDPRHDAEVIARLQAHLTQIERDVARYLDRVDILTFMHAHLCESLEDVKRRAADGGR